MRFLLIVLSVLFFTVPAYGTEWILTKHDINRVYDGDTFFINLKGLSDVFGHDLPIRVKDMDAPELRSSCALPIRPKERLYAAMSRDYLIEVFEQSSVIRIHNVQRDSFFRILADVEVDDIDLKDIMIDAGYAHAAIGGRRVGWCDDPRVLALEID